MLGLATIPTGEPIGCDAQFIGQDDRLIDRRGFPEAEPFPASGGGGDRQRQGDDRAVLSQLSHQGVIIHNR